MTEKRFSIKEGSSIGLSSIYTDNGKVMTQLEVLDVLIKQHETIQTLTDENEQLKQENEWLKSEIQKLYNFVKIDVDHNIEVYPKSLMEPILEILKIIGDVE